MKDMMEEYGSVMVAAFLAVLGGIWWVVRNILTNKSQIDLLKQQSETMADLLKEVRDDQKQMVRDIQNLAPR